MKTLLLLLSFLNSYKIVWEDTHFKIPLNENTHVYYEIPKAVVYDSFGNVVKTEVYYQRGVNHTTLKVVNSLHVKTFKVDYKAFLPEIGRESIQTIQFEIIDIIKPSFRYIPEISMPVKAKKKTEKEIIEDLIYEDNYYDNKELIVNVNGLENVNVNIPGKYKIVYEIIDPSFNISKEERYYEVFNNIPPEIKVKLPIKIEYGSNFNYLDYFTFYDEFNSIVKTNVDTSKINYQKIGLYQIEVTIENSVGLKANGVYSIEIVDTKKPILVVKDKLEFNYLDKIDLKELIVEVKDNYDNLSINDVIITGYYDFNILGRYEIVYEVSDSSLNTQIVKISFSIVDKLKPEIELIEDEIIVNVYDVITNYYKYFIISDNYNSLDDLKIVFNTKDINFNKIGDYYFTIEVTDESKNTKKERVMIYIRDLEPPKIEVNYQDYIYIDQYGLLNDDYFLKYFIISDNYYEKSEISIEINEEINFYETDELERTFIFKDPSGNITKVSNVQILIFETRPAILEMKLRSYKYFIGDEIPNLENFVKDYYDYTNNLEDLILDIEEQINFNKIGQYIITYKVYNKMINNQTTKEVLFYVDFKTDNKSKILNLEVKQGDEVDILSGVSLTEDIIKYEVFPKVVNTEIPGIKKRKFILYDKRGNITTLNQEIKVTATEVKPNYQKLIIINIVSTVGFVIFIKIKSRKKDLF